MTAISEEEAKKWEQFFVENEVICHICRERIEYNTRGGWCSLTNYKTEIVAFCHMDCYIFPGAERPEDE